MMQNTLATVYIRNALELIRQEQRTSREIHQVYSGLQKRLVKADKSVSGGFAENFLSNPFISTALGILEKFSGNYKIKQALKLLKEAGAEVGR